MSSGYPTVYDSSWSPEMIFTWCSSSGINGVGGGGGGGGSGFFMNFTIASTVRAVCYPPEALTARTTIGFSLAHHILHAQHI